MPDRKSYTVIFHLSVQDGHQDALFGPSPPAGLSEEAVERWSAMNSFFPPIMRAMLGALRDIGLEKFVMEQFQVAGGHLPLAVEEVQNATS